MNIELIKEIMDTFGVGPEEAIKMSQMPEIQGVLSAQYAGGQDAEASAYARQVAGQRGPAFGSMPGDTPQVRQGSMQGGLFQETPQCPPGSTWNGTTCAAVPQGPSSLGPISL